MCRLAEPPLFTELSAARNVLIAGAGGGFDIYAGLPLALALHKQGKRIHLGSLSFADLSLAAGDVGPDSAVADAQAKPRLWIPAGTALPPPLCRARIENTETWFDMARAIERFRMAVDLRPLP